LEEREVVAAPKSPRSSRGHREAPHGEVARDARARDAAADDDDVEVGVDERLGTRRHRNQLSNRW